MSTTDLTKDTFETTIDQEGIVLVDWWGPTCPPCRMFAPIYEKASDKHPDVKFCKVNTANERQLSGEFEIRAIPTIMAFRDGILVFAQEGMIPAAALDKLVDAVKGLDMEKVRAEVEKHEHAAE